VEVRQILLRTDTAANWSSVNPVLGEGEIATESDTTLLKIGDGVTAWNSLPYSRVNLTLSRNGTTVTVGATGDDAVLPAATTSLAGVMSAADKTKLDGITTLGDVGSGDNNVFTGVNSFLNSSGQTFGTDAAIEDGIVIAGRPGGSSSYRVTVSPEVLSGNRQLTAPDRSGTLITSGDSGTVTNAMLATITTANKVSAAALDIDGATDLGSALADADLILVDDGGGGTNRKAAVTRISDYTFGKVGGDITINSAGVAAIGNGVIVNADINASAGIVDTKLATITTAGKVANSATTATSANTANAIVARDANGSVGVAALNGGPLAGFRNLLINANPIINQRSYVSGTNTTGANQYTLDRWRVVTSGQNITFSDSAGIRTVTAPAGGVEQVVEAGSVIGGTYTLSWTGTATATVNGGSVVSGGTVTLTGNQNATVRFSNGTFSLAQLEVGSVNTAFERRPIGIEVALCQRYFCTLADNELQGGSITRRYAAGSTTYSAGGGNFPVEMRIAPTATIPTITYTNGNADSLTLLLGTKGAAVRMIPSAAGTFVWSSSSPFQFDAEL
jgi:hypothetical protein